MSTLPARASIEYTCRLLRSYGVDLTAEALRQAKFDSDTVYQPLLQALHDLALCTAAGLPRGCGEGIRQLKQQIQQETVDGSTLPPEGVKLTQHLLMSWECPAALIIQLSLPHNSSRTCLLALAWLIQHTRLFDRALEYLQMPQQLLQLLPPYPQDTSCTAACQQHYTAAVSAAQQHSHKIQQLIQQQPAATTAAGLAGGSCWQQVQAAAHHLLSTYRAATLRLQLLTSLQEGREKLLHDIHQQQQQPTVATGKSSRHKQARVLTAFELQLLTNPVLLRQYQNALQQGCSLLQQQLQCVQAAETFFAWAESVVEEDQKSPATAAAAAADGKQPHQQQQQQDALLPAPAVAEILPLVQQLPAADSAAAASVLQKIIKQLQQAAVQQGGDLLSCSAARGFAVVAAYQKAAAAAMAAAGSVPLLPRELLDVPVDIQQQLHSVKQQQLKEQVAKQDAAAVAENGKQQHWIRQQVTAEQLRLLSAHLDAAQQQQPQQQQPPQQQQQQQQLSGVYDALEGLSLGSGSVGGVVHDSRRGVMASRGVHDVEDSGTIKGSVVSVTTELQRLSTLSMHVARQLAKTRASNKQQMQAASDMLSGAEDGSAGHVVIYKS